MKTMTCKELGGPCDAVLAANSWEEMVKKMTEHLRKEHPAAARDMQRLNQEDPGRWGREMKPRWEAKPPQ